MSSETDAVTACMSSATDVDQALDAMRSQDLDKEQALDEFGAIVAVAGVTFEVMRGEIFCLPQPRLNRLERLS